MTRRLKELLDNASATANRSSKDQVFDLKGKRVLPSLLAWGDGGFQEVEEIHRPDLAVRAQEIAASSSQAFHARQLDRVRNMPIDFELPDRPPRDREPKSIHASAGTSRIRRLKKKPRRTDGVPLYDVCMALKGKP